MLALLLACNNAASSVALPPTVDRVVLLTVTARHEGEEPMGMGAQVRAGVEVERERSLKAGECQRPTAEAGGEIFADQVKVQIGEELKLPWMQSAGRYGAVGPLKGVDPAWQVGNLSWLENGKSHEYPGILRFGAEPQIKKVERQADGSVVIEWDAREAGSLSVLSPELSVVQAPMEPQFPGGRFLQRGRGGAPLSAP